MTFQDQVIVVTGGNSGIGRAIVNRFHGHGAQVVVFGRNAETLAETVNALGSRAQAINGDVTRLDDLKNLVAEVKQKHGRINHLIVNAGIAQPLPIEAVDEAAFDATMNINLKGAYFTIQQALPLMGKGSTITLVASGVVHRGFANFSVYTASKAGLSSLARSLSAELTPRGIRVNTINPGPIETPIFERMGLPQDQVSPIKDGFSEMVPLKRMGNVEEIAGLATFLAGPDATYMVGTELNADGGITNF